MQNFRDKSFTAYYKAELTKITDLRGLKLVKLEDLVALKIR